MYNLETNTIQLSLYAGQKPLLAADWNPFDSTRFFFFLLIFLKKKRFDRISFFFFFFFLKKKSRIGALIDKKWAIWNLREQNPRSIYTEIEDIAFVERGKHFQFYFISFHFFPHFSQTFFTSFIFLFYSFIFLGGVKEVRHYL
mgnify:CR=1 FL=1